MTEAIDYTVNAELYSSNKARLAPVKRYMRFKTTAEAVRYAVEQWPPSQIGTLTIEAGEDRYVGKAIKALYDAPAYPLLRRAD